MTNILVTTLGGSWQILPELLGFTNPQVVDLFKNHPEKESMDKARSEKQIVPADEVWVVTTTGKQTDDSLKNVQEWYEMLDAEKRPVLRIWQVRGTNSLATKAECTLMSEGIDTIVFHASCKAEKGRLMLSLAGGRKTMSTITSIL
ncbi:MAG: CRISPR-associated ring nuclease [Thermodesulfobacteriota bacterium]|nr:CRISPR-associated ring nuclease [Thermodesulfobacteriota bacterium]